MTLSSKNNAFKRLISNKNLIIFFVILALVSVALIFLSGVVRTENKIAVIQKDGVTLYEIPLDEVAESYTVSVGGNVLLVENGRISMLSADCPDKLCVRQGAITNSTRTIVCLPNKVTVFIKSGEKSADAVIG